MIPKYLSVPFIPSPLTGEGQGGGKIKRQIMKNKKLIPLSRPLRASMTDAESKIWNHLRKRQLQNFKFRRQHIVGNYIVDFICLEKNIIIEIDGGQHNVETDKQRSIFLEMQGFRILRFWNNDVLSNIDGVLETIETELKTPPS